jgi:hypothetical protein
VFGNQWASTSFSTRLPEFEAGEQGDLLPWREAVVVGDVDAEGHLGDGVPDGDGRRMLAGGAWLQLLGDLGVREATADEARDLLLSGREVGNALDAPRRLVVQKVLRNVRRAMISRSTSRENIGSLRMGGLMKSGAIAKMWPGGQYRFESRVTPSLPPSTTRSDVDTIAL